MGKNIHIRSGIRRLLVECNTLNKRKSIRSGSKIYLTSMVTEQNFLFEMLIGTYKVKCDTNSLSTADKTDVKIVLKKKEASLRFCGADHTNAPAISESGHGRSDGTRDQGKRREFCMILRQIHAACVHGLFFHQYFVALSYNSWRSRRRSSTYRDHQGAEWRRRSWERSQAY